MLGWLLTIALTLAPATVTLPRIGPLPQARPDAPGAVKPDADKGQEQNGSNAGAAPASPEGEHHDKVDEPPARSESTGKEPETKNEPARETGARPQPDASPAPGPVPVPEEKPAPPPPPIAAEDAEAYRGCLAALTAQGARFTEIARVDDGDGCGIDKPLKVTALSKTVSLAPDGLMRCETALALSRMVDDMIVPAARLALSDHGPLTAVHQASTYVCRKRNGVADAEISEHARGNAVDIMALEFSQGTVPMRIARIEDSDFPAAFQRAVNALACLYFKTVLPPGSDAAHQDHLHLDVLERKGGYRYCR